MNIFAIAYIRKYDKLNNNYYKIKKKYCVGN